MKFFNQEDVSEVIDVVKDNQTNVRYYLSEKYEFDYNVIPAGTIQEWHQHEYITELLFVLKGQLVIHWLHEKKQLSRQIVPNDLVDMGKSFHTVENSSDEEAHFIIVKMNLSKIDGKIKDDKKLI